MATGGREDSTDNASIKDEQQVGEQTEGIFLSYVCHMNVLRGDEDSRSLVEEVHNAGQVDCDLDKIGRQLAVIGDDIYKRYQDNFDAFLKEINPNFENAYDYFKKIASSVFETGFNWGRVLALLGFGYRLAVHVWRNGRSGFLLTIARWLARYLVESHIARWIVRQGGWAAVLKLTNHSVQYVLMALGFVLVLQFVIKRLGSGS